RYTCAGGVGQLNWPVRRLVVKAVHSADDAGDGGVAVGVQLGDEFDELAAGDPGESGLGERCRRQ
ncbi:MAG: hypothetical protein ACREXR_02790, partial [Gammaproteobacteria bacterium]